MSQAFKVSISNAAANRTGLVERKFKENSKLITNGEPQKKFTDYMKEGLETVNNYQNTADKMATNLATGKTENIHETMLAVSQAEISFKLMVQLRNKALEAYQEIMRIQV